MGISTYTATLSNQLKRLKNYSYDAEYSLYHYANSSNKLRVYLFKHRLMRKYHIVVADNVRIHGTLKLPHPINIVIGKNAFIGNNVTIYQNVTIGGKNIGDTQKGYIPVIENDCVIFAGAKVLGNVIVKKGSTIGANAVLLTSTDQESVYVGIPARKVKQNVKKNNE